MDGVWVQIALVGVLVIANGYFAGSEIALITLTDGQVERLSHRGRRGRALAGLHDDLNRFLSTIQIGVTLAGFLASASAAVTLAQPLTEPLSFLGAAARPTAVVLVTAILTYLTLVLGELVPKRFALQRAEGWALAAAPSLVWVGRLTRPVVWLLGRSTNLVIRLGGGDPDVDREDMTDEDVRDLVTSRRSLRPEQRTIVTGAFEVADRRVREILQPRRDVVALDASLSAEDGLAALLDAGVSRAPVIVDDLEEVRGVVHLRDVATADATVGDCARDVPIVPDTMGVLDLLRMLRHRQEHLAVVVDEYGTTVGIVTLEDALEEVVGEIYDEADRASPDVRRRDDGFELDGSLGLHDAASGGVELPFGDYATVGGLILDRLGRLPEGGETVEAGGWDLHVEEVDGTAIRTVRATPTDPSGSGSPGGRASGGGSGDAPPRSG